MNGGTVRRVAPVLLALGLLSVHGDEKTVGDECAGRRLREIIEGEVAALRADLPKFIVKLGQPYPARQVLVHQKLRLTSGRGDCFSAPWRLKVDINVKKGPYRKEHRVILEIPATYPAEKPAVRFASSIAHTYLTELEEAHSRVPTHILARTLQDAKSLRDLLGILYDMLQGPLAAAGGDSVWQSRATAFSEETEVVKKYRKKRRHKKLFTVAGFDTLEFVDARIREAIANLTGMSDAAAARQLLTESGVIAEVIPGMAYSFPVFTEAFCKTIMEEVQRFYKTGLPARRPNSMNNYGIILNEIGLEPLMFALQDALIQPLAAALFPKEGSELESHHAFTVRYKGGEDTHLDVHTDDSDVTFNVNIFGDYEGCPLVFCGMVGAPDHRHFRAAYQHRLGYAVMHSGRLRHGAEDITGGERMNLIVWSYSYNFRRSAMSKKKHRRESGMPDVRCLSYTHDRDYGRFKQFPPGKKEQFYGRGWCPQKGKEYEGFIPDVASPGAHGGPRSRRYKEL